MARLSIQESKKDILIFLWPCNLDQLPIGTRI